jgi:hypothetical protein
MPDIFKPMATQDDDESQSAVEGPIRPPITSAEAHDAWFGADHKDNVAARIAEPNTNGEYGPLDGSNPATMGRLAKGAFLPSEDLG